MLRILLTHTPDALKLQFGDRALAALEAHGTLTFNKGGLLQGDALVQAAQGCDIVVTDRMTAVPADVLRALPDVIAVMRCAVDIRNIDVAAASAEGILVTRSIPAFATSVAELALGLMLDAARGISRAALAYAGEREPEVAMGRQLRGDTLGIVGFGAIGQELARMARALRMDVLVSTPEPIAPQDEVTAVSFDALLAQASYIVCLAPATPETAGMFGAKAFAAMRGDAVFLNLARGELVDEIALAAALDRGEIAGAALDVGSAPDQKPPLALARRKKVIATPHIGGQTPEAIEGQALHLAAQVAALSAGQIPPDAVNAELATRLTRWHRARDA